MKAPGSPITPPPQTPGRILDKYAPLAGVYDETVDARGRPRELWQPFLKGLGEIGVDDLRRRWEQAQRQVIRDGFTFNPYDSDGGASRPWELDAVPLLLAEKEWSQVERGLAQRAELLGLMLKDLFGPQQLLKDKVLPPQTLFAHPGYFPAYHNLHSGDHGFLHQYAADLARSPDGMWWVIADRTRAPFGLGFVLENRIVTSRLLPVQFRQCQVRRLAPFFIALKESLRERAARTRENPRVAIWTKGPQSRAYFEDAYLARYLGYQLVEGGDLAVRENKVMLKTLGGLLPVEVLFRRLEDDDCDPVELNPASVTGVAGLLEVLRSGNVSIANPLGSRIAESPLFMAFLPSICEHLLGEELIMPSVATWWCGEEKELQYVLEHLDELIIRKAYRMVDDPPYHPAQMSAAEKEDLARKIKARPLEYIGQESVVRSTTPVFTGKEMTPWSLALRSFLVRRGDSYVSLPGGLARVAKDPLVLDQTTTGGERSQDVWILSDEAIEEVSLLTPLGHSVPLRRSGAELPSRVADNLFWLGRNVERAEGSARLLRTTLASITGESESRSELRPLLRALAEQGQVDPDYVIPGLNETLPSLEEMLPKAVFDQTRSKSLVATIREAFRLISIVRDRVAVDAWRILQRVELMTRFGAKDINDVLEFLDRLILDLVAFSGLSSENMTRTQGWRFLDLGRRLERAWQTSMLLRSSLTTIPDEEQPVLEAVLLTADSIMTYRSRYLANIQPAPVLDLLLTDETNPRSVAYQLAVISDHVDQLPRDGTQAERTTEQRLALSLLNAVRLADIHELSRASSADQRDSLERLLKRLCDQLPNLSDAVSNRFLIHAGLPRHFGTMERTP